jgi:predicted Zn finger-like uncharacterized protein
MIISLKEVQMAKVCPECGSTLFIKHDKQIIKRVPCQRYRCKKCYRVFVHPRYTGKSRAKDASKQPVEGSVVVLDDDTED